MCALVRIACFALVAGTVTTSSAWAAITGLAARRQRRQRSDFRHSRARRSVAAVHCRTRRCDPYSESQYRIVLPTPFLTMSGISTDGEGGFLGLAFHPDYFNAGMPGFGKFYVNVTTNSTTTDSHPRVHSLGDRPERGQSGSLREILSFAQPQTNHNGGWIGFSPE